MLFKIIRNSILSKNTSIGYFCRIVNSNIGEFTYVSHRTTINNADIGKFCSIAENVKIGFGIHPKNFLSTNPIFYSLKSIFNNTFLKKNMFEDRSKTYIGNDVLIGANVFINDGITINNGVIVAAGSVVTKDLKPYGIYAGVPAKLIDQRFSDEIINEIEKINPWKYKSRLLMQNTQYFNTPVTLKVLRSLKEQLEKKK